jgi:hypothetical protein
MCCKPHPEYMYHEYARGIFTEKKGGFLIVKFHEVKKDLSSQKKKFSNRAE